MFLTAGSIFFVFFPGRAHQNPSNPGFQHVFTRLKKILESIGDVYKTGEALKQPSQALYIYISIIELDIPFLKTIVDLQQSNVMRLRRENENTTKLFQPAAPAGHSSSHDHLQYRASHHFENRRS